MGKLTKTFFYLLGILSLNPFLLQAKNSNELLYTEPFDLAAGGTTLTRASQEGIVFGNPALLPLGGAWIRWLGLQTSFMLDRDLAEEAQSGKLTAGDQGVLDQLFSRSLHLGQTATLSFLNQNLAISVFDRVEIDVEGDRFGDYGMPSLVFEVEAYAGGLLSYAMRPVRWFSLGLTAKQLYVSEPRIFIPVTDTARVQSLLSDTGALRDELSFNQGLGFDAGLLFLAQGKTIDYSLGFKIEDLGSTQFSGEQESFPQAFHLGLGLALHGSREVLHLSLEYRDILNAYDEKTFKKVYAGARFMLRSMVGIAAGLYQGIPSIGLRVDLLLFKLGVTAYGRELGDFPGDRQRNMVQIYLSTGF